MTRKTVKQPGGSARAPSALSFRARETYIAFAAYSGLGKRLIDDLIDSHERLLMQAKLLERSLRYHIAKSEKEGDDEGASMKTLTLNLLLVDIRNAEGRS